MTYLLDTAEPLDNDEWTSGIRFLGTQDTKEQLNSNPLFQQAELYIVGLLPAAALASPGMGRSYPGRKRVLIALWLLVKANFLQGGESTADRGSSSTITTGGTERFGPFSISGAGTGSSTSRSSRAGIADEDSDEWLRQQANDILIALGASITTTGDFEIVGGYKP